MDVKELISDFLRSNDTARFTLYQIDYFFHQEKNFYVVENLTRDVLLKLLKLLEDNKFNAVYITAYNKTPDAISAHNITVFYSVIFKSN